MPNPFGGDENDSDDSDDASNPFGAVPTFTKSGSEAPVAPPELDPAASPFGDVPLFKKSGSAAAAAPPDESANPFGLQMAKSGGAAAAPRAAAPPEANPFGGESPPAPSVAPNPAALAAAGASSTPFKIIVVGDTGTGKTCLMMRFSDGRFDDNSMATIGVDVSTTTLDLGSTAVGLQLWDTVRDRAIKDRDNSATPSPTPPASCHPPPPPSLASSAYSACLLFLYCHLLHPSYLAISFTRRARSASRHSHGRTSGTPTA